MKKKPAIAAVTGVILLAVAGLFLIQSGDRLHAKARKEWKEKEVAEIARSTSDAAWLAAETNRLKTNAAPDPSDSAAWLSDRLILMKNGEWMIYASKCSKEDRRIHDIFVGRGSDGKWYYSTFHFCLGMVSLRMDDQPENLTKFGEIYFLREFDGHSDECLNLTWPPKHQ
jgi:hypothetical protein